MDATNMSAGTLFFLVLIGGALLAMIAMHRGGGSHRMGMGCGGHSHGSSADHQHGDSRYDRRDDRSVGRPQDGQQAGSARRHGGC